MSDKLHDIPAICDEVRALREENEWLLGALRESVELQSHYAKLLNDYDGGRRKAFASAEEWIKRLDALAKGG